MEANPAVVAPVSIGVVPSSTFSKALINAILGAYVECAATIEEIANQNNIAVCQVLECLHEQAPFLRGMLNTLETRVRIIASRAEAVAIETLREIALFAREQESRRKAASKLLSHFAKLRAPAPQARGTVAGVPPVATSSASDVPHVNARKPASDRPAATGDSPALDRSDVAPNPSMDAQGSAGDRRTTPDTGPSLE